MSGRWLALSAQFTGDDKIQQLGERHGPGGPLLVIHLLEQAQLQEAGGVVQRTFRDLAHATFITTDEARAIVRSALEVGVIDEVDPATEARCSIRLRSWDRWQAAFRKARSRAKDPPESHGKSRPVTGSHAKSHRPDPTRPDPTKTSLPAAGAAGEERDYPLCDLLVELIVANGGRRKRVGQRWRDAERLLIDKDGVDPAEAERVLRWCQADSFWQSNVMCMEKFRAQYDQLRLKASSNGSGKRGQSVDDRVAHFAEMAERLRREEEAA